MVSSLSKTPPKIWLSPPGIRPTLSTTIRTRYVRRLIRCSPSPKRNGPRRMQSPQPKKQRKSTGGDHRNISTPLATLRMLPTTCRTRRRRWAPRTGTTRATMETHLRSLAVYTEGQIQLMLDEFDRVNAYSFQAKTISVTHKVTGGGVQEYASGGVVPGPRGSAQMAVVHGGETILPTHKSSGGRTATPMVNNITIHAGLGADPNAISRALVEALQRYERTSGPIPIRTRSA